ncbi:MAG: hypothetical protein JWQ21_2990 [Herminiimonas sp.]|nr:hypothetical protein [Herminiimonas sp.]
MATSGKPVAAETRAIIALFVFALWLPLLASGYKASSSNGFDMAEKRRLAAMPKLDGSISAIKAFPEKFSRYYDDNFGLRDVLIRWHNLAKGVLLGQSPVRNAIIGKQGWLFLADGNILADYQGTHPFKEEELERWRVVLEGKKRWLASQGIQYLFLVAPDKPSVYPEFMPDNIGRIGGGSRLDQLISYLKKYSDIEILDLRPSLREGKGAARVFHKTDTHWNEQGAYIAYREIMNRLSKEGRPFTPRNPNEFTQVEETTDGHDIAGMMGLQNVFKEKNIHLMPKTERCAREVAFRLDNMYAWPKYTPDHAPYARECKTASVRAVFFQDSFGTGLVNFISEHFRRIVYVWDYPNHAVLNSIIQQEHPDIVIEERVERHLKPMLPEMDREFVSSTSWKCNGKVCEVRGSISNRFVSLVNEHGSAVLASITGKTITVKDWNNIKGTVSDNLSSINWSNGAVWER